MSKRHLLGVFTSCARMGFKHALADKFSLFGIFLIYGTLILFYAGIVRSIPLEDIVKLGLNHELMIWYIAITEAVVFTSSDWNYKELQNDIENEAYFLALIRPVSSVFIRISSWCGEMALRASLVIPFGMLSAYLLTGIYPMTALGTLGLLASVPLATFILNAALYFIGAACLWIVQAEPAFWIWQKAIFLCGAMLWPIIFYPAWFKTVIWFTPFPALLAHAGNWALGADPVMVALGVISQFFWFALILFLLGRFDRLVLRRIQSGEV